MTNKLFAKIIILFLAHLIPVQILLANRLEEIEKQLQKADEKEKPALLLKLALLEYKQDPDMAIATAHKGRKLAENLKEKSLIADAYNNLGILHQKLSDYDSALYYYNATLKLNDDSKVVADILDKIGVLYKELSMYDKSVQYHKDAMKLKETLGDKIGVAASLNNIGNVHLKHRDYDNALEYYKKSLTIREELSNEDEIAASYINLGNVYKSINEYEKALTYLTKALELREKSGNKDNIAYTLNAIGNFYLQLKIYDKAREYYSQSLEIRQELNIPIDIAASYNNIGTVHRDLSNYESALEYYNKALEIRVKLGNKQAQAYSLNSIGGVYWIQKKYPSAIDYFSKALDLRKEVGNKFFIASSLKNLGILYKDKGDIEKSLDYYSQALALYMETNDVEGIAEIQNLKGNLFAKVEDSEKAIEFYTNALDIYKESNIRNGIAFTSNNLADVLLSKGRTEEAIVLYKEALANANIIQNKDLSRTITLGLSKLYKAKNDFKTSLEYFEYATALQDSISQDMNKKRIAEIEFEGTIKLKEKELEAAEFEIIQKEEKNKQYRIYMMIGIAVILLIAVFLILIYYQFKQKKKANYLLEINKKELEIANTELEKTNGILELKNIQITDSINYAKRIQRAILPANNLIKKHFPESFIFYRPKDIVSGDFYWFVERNDYVYIASIDCTGHGVPGAFMSMIGNSVLNEVVNSGQAELPADILNLLDIAVIKALKQDTEDENKQEDGMELALCRINKKNKTIDFSGANHKLYIINDTESKSVAGDLFPIGGMYTIKKRKNARYSNHTISYNEGDRIYMFSDGFSDQFGGPDGYKFKSNNLVKLLSENRNMRMEELLKLLSNTFEDWKGDGKQIDDVLVMGIEMN